MANLIIPDVEEAVLQRLQERARARGTTAETEARVVLAEALQRQAAAGTTRPVSGTRTRLAELESLKQGWMDGLGQAVPAASLDWLGDAFDRYYHEGLPPARFYPTPAGGVRAEWSFGPHEASLEIGLPSQDALWHWLNIDTDDDEQRSMNLSQAADWGWLVDRIRSLAKDAG